MDMLIAAAALALTAAVCGTLIREKNPVGALALTACGCVALLRLIWDSLTGLLSWWSDLADRFLGQALLAPLGRCVAIALVVRLTAELCRDGGQRALAVQVELAGAVCGMIALLPLLQEVMELMGP